MNFEAFPARTASFGHMVVTVLAVFSALAFSEVVVVALLLAAACAAHYFLGRAVHNVVSPAYSDGHPIVNLPPELGGPESD